MYYILNETDQIVAADNTLLELCGVTHIDELSSGIITNEILFDMKSDEDLNIISLNGEENFKILKTSLSSLLGNLTLVTISSENKIKALSTSLINNEIDTTIEKSEDLDEVSLALELPNNDELFDLVVDEEPSKEEVSQQSDKPKLLTLDESPIDLGITDQNDEISLDIFEEEVSEIIIDTHSISQKIGISNDDYQNFLNDFIDTALSLEKDLQSDNPNMRNDAINTLSHLSDVLHLTVVGDILTNIKNNDNNTEDIASLYSTLSRITAKKEEEVTAPVEEKVESEEETLELFDTPDAEPMIQEAVTPRKKPNGNSFGTISLEGIQPKHFDFQLEEAANDLSLPIELIEEFVHDFIDQAHIETKKMLEAYEEGDLETIQKIGHLLKGASSNLRINALSDTLYKIQFCEDSSNLEHLIKDYWAHFLSFENQINAISH